jgi:hypothetical protein
MSRSDHNISITVSADEQEALSMFWNETNDLGEIMSATGVDLLDVLAKVAGSTMRTLPSPRRTP